MAQRSNVKGSVYVHAWILLERHGRYAGEPAAYPHGEVRHPEAALTMVRLKLSNCKDFLCTCFPLTGYRDRRTTEACGSYWSHEFCKQGSDLYEYAWWSGKEETTTHHDRRTSGHLEAGSFEALQGVPGLRFHRRPRRGIGCQHNGVVPARRHPET